MIDILTTTMNLGRLYKYKTVVLSEINKIGNNNYIDHVWLLQSMFYS